ncbi:hypothetical protein [Corynebacterium provencense]|uniref:hypothetical protein n=1 Tax=Corynebacterium provencense TaxID=1737425 RepID=UPI00082F8B4A|nr:hypothetical protein [Corynebacterium provencense]
MPDNRADDIRTLWQIYRSIHPRHARPDLKTQTKRARASLLTAVVELEALIEAQAYTPDGVLDLDHLTREAP